MDNLMKIWMPINKNTDGSYSAIITDDSVDRDDEMMAESVMDDLSKKLILPALADHENKMSSWVGGFKNLEKIERKGHIAVTGQPQFFSKDANPKAEQIRKQIDEAHAMGMSCGISIGAKPIKSEMVEKNGENIKCYTEIEVMEGTFTPVQSNRNSYTYVAKSLGLEKDEKKGYPPKVESCIKQLKAKGMDKEKAIKICQAKAAKKSCEPCTLTKSKEEQISELISNFKTEIKKIIEVATMTKKEDIKKDETPNPEGEGSEEGKDKPAEEDKPADAPKDAPADEAPKGDEPKGEDEPAADNGNQDPEAGEAEEKKISPAMQKVIDTKIQEGIKKAVKEMPLYKAITENPSFQPAQPQDSKPMGFIEKHFANKAGFQEEVSE